MFHRYIHTDNSISNKVIMKIFRHTMRVDLSPRLGGHTVANQPPTTVLLSFTFILPSSSPPERCNGVTAGVEQSHELNLNLRFTLL